MFYGISRAGTFCYLNPCFLRTPQNFISSGADVPSTPYIHLYPQEENESGQFPGSILF